MTEIKLKSCSSPGIENRYSNLLDLKDFFAGVEDYVILKLSDDFPSYYEYSDIDIFCKDSNSFLNHVLAVGRKYQRQGFEIKVDRTNEHLHVDFYPPAAKRLDFRFDLISDFSYEKFEVNPQYSEIVLQSRRRINQGGLEIQVPSLEHDLAIRFFEYAEWYDRRPDKIKHWDYIKKHKCSDFVDVVNRYTDLNISTETVNETINLRVSKKNEHDGRLREIQNSITVEGIEFSNVRLTKCLTNSVGFNCSYIIKIEHEPNPRKLRNIVQEAEIIKYLNSCGCVSCPKLHSAGKLPSGENYIIMERLHQKDLPTIGDMIFSLIEQKNLGVYQGDFKPENTVFDGSVCYLIDYDQAQEDDRFKQMGNIEFIDWIAKDFRQRRGHDFFTDPSRNFDKQQICSLFVNDSFDMKYTTVFEKQKTTNTQSGIYHNFIHPKIFIKGARGLEDRKDALDKIEFAKDESVLDVGCNMGLLSHYLHDRGCKACGVDLDINIILAARMVANIINKNVEFRFCDIDKKKPAEYYDTICLFSVLHHLQNLTNAVEYISAHCGRIILEARLKEGGSKPVDGKWISTNGWNFESLDEMVKAMEKMFKGFHFDKLYGQCDRNRFVLSMVNPQNAKSVKESKVQTQLSNGLDSDKKNRIDYFLIWGHGLAYTKQILEIIRDHKDFGIISIVKKPIGDISKFVEDIYSCDSVPLKHLISKTRYLLNTPPEIIFILVKNNNPQEMFFGEGSFRHIQCKLIKDVKEQIRNRFNPRNRDGTRTENHVIHASDYESQVKHVLKVLNLPSVEYYTRKPNPELDVPFHIEPFDDYTIKQVSIDNLLANILGLGIVPITQTPHYKYVTGDKSAYCDYLARHLGKELIEDHLPEAYDSMIQNFRYDYVTHNGRRSIILAEPFDGNNYRIIDGVHRAAVLKHQGVQTVAIAEPIRNKTQQGTHPQGITALIFSKDRAMQLQATIESFLLHSHDKTIANFVVLFKASNPVHKQQYNELKKKFPVVAFVEETDFRKQVLSLIENGKYVLFLVDDNIFVRPFSLRDVITALDSEKNAIGFSLRLGKNTDYCYSLSSPQKLPEFGRLKDGILKYNWPGAECDFGYPLEVSSSVYRVGDILDLLKRLSYQNPNTLEAELATNRNMFSSDKRSFLCFHQSVAFCNPVNKVQNVYAGNRGGADENYTVQKLAELYRQGVTIDVDRYSGFISNGAHQEVQLCFKNNTAGSVKISVITPCYNQARYLPQAIESIVNQTYRNWECIIVNDCSTDNTAEVAGQLIAKYADRNIRFIDKPANTGLADVRNVGIEAATSEWVLPLDSDDMFEPTFMQKAVDIIQGTEKVDIVFANMQKFGAENGEWIPDEYSRRKILACNTMPYSSLYRKELWRKVGGYSNLISAIGQSEDWNFWISCSKHNPVVRRIPEKLFLYRVDPNSMYHRLIKNNWHQTWALLATCHPDMYPPENLTKAWELIASSSSAVYEKILNAVDKCSQYGLIFFWRGLLNERWGKTAEAISDYKTASEKASNGDWQPLAKLAQLYHKTGDTSAAAETLKKLQRMKPDFEQAEKKPVEMRNKLTPAGKKMKILFYYNGLVDLDHSRGGTVAAVLNFANILPNDKPGITIHLTGDGVRTHRRYEFFELLPLPPFDERDRFIADYDVVFWVTQVIYFKDVPKPHGQVWVLYQHCWDMHKETLARMSDLDIVLCLSELHAKELAHHYGVPAQKQIVIPNLIDTDLYSQRTDNRRNHSIIFAGALHEHKGVHILLEAFKLVRQQLRDADLHIYGSRDMWSGKDDYEERLKGMNLENVYFHGYVNPEKMPQTYLKHGIICLPSRLESFGLVIIEAQAGGCIPVAHNVGGVSATLIDGETGFLYSPNTPEKLAQTIIHAIGTIDNNPSMRQRAINFVRSNFSTQAWDRYRSRLWNAIGISENKNMVAASSDVNSVGSEELHLFAQGVAELRNGKPEKALDYFSMVLKAYPRLSNLNFAMATAFTQLGKLDSAKNCCEMELAVQPRHSGTAALLERINCAIAQCENKNSVPDTLLNSGKELIMVSEQKQAPAAAGRPGIIIYGHTRPTLLRNILESLQRQGVTANVHVWLDGHAGRASLKGPVEQCRELVKTEFPWAVLTTATGNIGIEKLMIDGLSFMSEHYEKIIVLEDDCFPTADAVAEFKKALDEIEKRDDVYSVYGHHFLTPSEGETITRFQGWGWATTRKKLLPVLSEMKKRFAMAEHDYLDWVRQNLTPEIIKRLDVTPGRNCVRTIVSHFCWDGCTCLLTAMRGLLHKKTAKRVVYNCGIGDDSMHFRPEDRFRLPPFNMINPGEVWNYYNDSPSQPHSPADRTRTVNSKPVIISNENQSSQAAEIVVDGICFKNVGRTKHQNNSVGFSDKYIIKIEHEKHPLKLRTLSEEIEIIRYLNEKECVSCPKLVSEGRLKSGERYCIQQSINGNREFNAADMVFSILEQKSFGVCQGDFKKENFLFDSNGVCYIIDYDQAVCDERFKSMNGVQYLEWFAQYMVQRWKSRPDDFYKWCGSGRDEVLGLFKNGAFNLARTTIFKEQITTDSQSGIYHSLNTNTLYIEGCRDLNPRLSALNGIEFKKGEKVLDIGCNMGLLSHYLYDRGCRITGVDMDPKIVTGAKMAANILGKDISFKHLDVDNSPITENYDTICLFSVIHHVKNFSQVTENIAQKCSRIILECGLKEHGSKPVSGEWTKTSGWEFASIEQLTCYLEKVFTGFKFHNYYGSVDRNRHIIALVKQPLCADGRGRDVQLPAAGKRQTQEKPEYLVSAIVSTFNSEKFIRGCIEDLENQTIADKLEIIVVNSGSEQNEESIVKEFQKRYGNIVYVKTGEREGLYSAWNRAVKIASGQFLTSANTDDRHRKDAFEVMADTLLKNTDVALVYGDQIVTDTPNPAFENHHAVELAKRPEFSKERLIFSCCVGSQPMWRKALHDELGDFDETLTCAGDWDFWLKVAGKYSFRHISEFLGLYYYNQDGIEHGRRIHGLYERYLVAKRYGNQYIPTIQPCQARGNPLVSIVMASYNAAGYIARAIESVLIQNYRNFELIVVDDGSTDRTAEIVRGFKNEPIKYFYKENGGVSSARNYALKKVSGSFVVILDSDDMITLDFIARHLLVFEQNPETDLVYCDDCFIDENDKPIRVMSRPEYSDQKALISALFSYGWAILPFRTCIRKSVFDKIGFYDERLIMSEDYDMLRRFVSQGLRMRHLPAALYLRHPTANSLSRSFNAAKAKGHFEVVRKFTETFTPEQLFPDIQWDEMPAEQKSLLAKCKAALVYIGIGEQYLASNAPDFAEAAFEMACAQLDDCCKIEPANHQVRNLREKCLSIRAKNLSSGRRGVYQPA